MIRLRHRCLFQEMARIDSVIIVRVCVSHASYDILRRNSDKYRRCRISKRELIICPNLEEKRSRASTEEDRGRERVGRKTAGFNLSPPRRLGRVLTTFPPLAGRKGRKWRRKQDRGRRKSFSDKGEKKSTFVSFPSPPCLSSKFRLVRIIRPLDS